jgi:hypothetical protein
MGVCDEFGECGMLRPLPRVVHQVVMQPIQYIDRASEAFDCQCSRRSNHCVAGHFTFERLRHFFLTLICELKTWLLLYSNDFIPYYQKQADSSNQIYMAPPYSYRYRRPAHTARSPGRRPRTPPRAPGSHYSMHGSALFSLLYARTIVSDRHFFCAHMSCSISISYFM